MKTLTSAAFLILGSGLAAAQNGADACTNADTLPAGPGSVAFDTNNCSDTGAPATNGALSQCTTISDDVWFLWVATDTGQHRFSTCGAANFDTELAVWSNPDGDGDCDNLVPLGCNDDAGGCVGFTSELSLPVQAGEQYFIQLGDANFVEGDNHGQGTLSITLENPPPANDDCASPEAVVGTGVFPFDTAAATTSGFGNGACGLNVNQDVFFSWTAPSAGDFRIDTCLATFDTRLAVYAGGDCNSTCVADDDDTCALQSVVDLNGLAGGESFLVQVGGFGGLAGSGSLTITDLVDPCVGAPDDAFEDNDDAASAPVVLPGPQPGLFVSQTDADWFSVSVPPLTTVYVQAIFDHVDGDVELALFDATGQNQLDQSISATDNEEVGFDNQTNIATDVLARVTVSGQSSSACNTYDLVVSLESGMPGFTYCPATANSTGFVAQITGSGSSSLTANDLLLVANPVPTDVPGLFINSVNQANIPFGSKIRCVAKPFRRSRVMRAQGSVLTIPIDNARIPEATQGSSHFFQAWFRDNPDPDFFGLSNGYGLTFRE